MHHLGPTVIEVLGDALLAAEFGNAVFAAQAIEDNADLLLSGEVPPGGSPDVSDGLLRARRSLLVSLSHRVPPRGYDELDSLPYTITSICPLGPDGEHRIIDELAAPQKSTVSAIIGHGRIEVAAHTCSAALALRIG